MLFLPYRELASLSIGFMRQHPLEDLQLVCVKWGKRRATLLDIYAVCLSPPPLPRLPARVLSIYVVCLFRYVLIHQMTHSSAHCDAWENFCSRCSCRTPQWNKYRYTGPGNTYDTDIVKGTRGGSSMAFGHICILFLLLENLSIYTESQRRPWYSRPIGLWWFIKNS